MLGEIIKSTEALRYHAKTAEIAGQNLAHVNDENYARQRVLSREGLMSKGQGGLNAASIEAGGLDHARNELLDKRVFAEFAETANLDTQKEILSFLQAALGESINRQSISGGLDGDHDSNLSAGGLARALDDLFNSFQELSASPDESTSKEEIVNKIHTLTKRFNDAGQAIDEIDSDLSSSVDAAVGNVNRLLDQIYEVNLQIKRFELLGQGKAVTYRDNRQGLLEDLSKLIDFEIDREINQENGNETGFWNISTTDHQNQKIELLSSGNGVTRVTKDFGNIITLENESGNAARVRAKISADGTLGHIEVLDGGSQYNDTEGPILFALAPPVTAENQKTQSSSAISAHNAGDVFNQGGKLFQARQNTFSGSDLSDSSLFIEIEDFPQNGQVFPESLRRYSDVESFEKGQQIYYEGKLYQAVDSVGAKSLLNVNESNQLQQKLTKGEVVELGGKFYQILENKEVGFQVNMVGLPNAKVGENIDGFLALGEKPPQVIDNLSYVASTVDTTRPDRWFLTKSYQVGDYVKFDDKFFQFTQDVFRGQEVDELAKAMQSLSYDQAKSYQEGDHVELAGAYFKFTADVPAFSKAETVVLNLTEALGTDAQPFDGVVKLVEDPNWHFVESNGSFKIADAFREFELSGLTGSEQTKQIRISGLGGDQSDNFNFDIFINGNKISLTEDVPSFTINGFDQNTFSENLKNKLLEIDKNGVAQVGVVASDPAFVVEVDPSTGDLLVSGASGLGDFDLTLTTEDITPVDSGNIPPSFEISEESAYIADKYNLIFSSEEFGELPISVAFQGNENDTANSFAKAIADDEILSQHISVIANGENVLFRAKKQDFEFTVNLSPTNGIEDLHNNLNNQIKKEVDPQSTPSSVLVTEAFEGLPVSLGLTNFEGKEEVERFNIIIKEDANYGEQYSFELNYKNQEIPIQVPAQVDRNLNELITQIQDVLLVVEQDGTFLEGNPAISPAFSVNSNFNGSLEVLGSLGTGEFELISSSDDLQITNEQDFFVTEYQLFLVGNDGKDIGSISVPYQGSEEATINALVEAINNDEIFNQQVFAEADAKELKVSGLSDASDFKNIRWDKSLIVSPDTSFFNPSVKAAKHKIELGSLAGVEQVQKTSLQFLPGPDSEQSVPFSVNINGVGIPLELPATDGDPLDPIRFSELESALKAINKDGSITEDGSISDDPAFDVSFVEESLTFVLSGNENLGSFILETNESLAIESTNIQEYLSDILNIEIKDDNGQLVESISVPYKTDSLANAKDIVNAINSNPNIQSILIAKVSGDLVVLESIDNLTKFTASISVQDNLNKFTVSEIPQLNQSDIASVQESGAQIARIEKNGIDPIGLVTTKVQSLDFKKEEDPMVFSQNDLFYFTDANGQTHHFLVTSSTPEIESSQFNPLDETWKNNFKIIKPQLLDSGDPSVILRKSFPVGHNLESGSLVELNIGLAEAVVKKGEITGFNILNSGNGLPGNDSVFAGGRELLVESGAIKGYQESRSKHLETFRTELNDLVTTFVEEINSIYNPDDEPNSYIFGFDAVLTRPVSGRNLLMEEEYGLFGREGGASINLYRDEVEMSLPYASSETFSLVNTTPIFPEEFDGQTLFYRGGDYAETFFRSDESGDSFSFYASASRMQNVTMENDEAYPGEDLAIGTEDDGRSLMMAYETIPFRLEGLEAGSKLPIIGDNFSFTALPSNPWNLATSLKVDQNFNSASLLTSNSGVSGSNEIALSIAEMGNENFIEKVSLLNANIGNTIADLNDNLEHQKSIETLLLDQRRAVSSVSIDEEVADLMRFQRSFQASSRVLSTLDKMLEIVVMGLVR